MTRHPDPLVERAAMELLEAALAEGGGDPGPFIENAAGIEPSVRARALALLAAESGSGSALRTGGAAALGADDAEEEAIPDRIGAYRIIRLLGRGGMGSVYLAERADSDFDLVTAIKVIKPGLASPQLIERFRRERRILASLHHPNIAQLYDGGELPSGAPYLVMEFIDGIGLGRWLESANPPLAERIDLMLQICDAVEFAHQNLIVHRDLTPGNVLVTADGVAKLIDFGIARPQGDGDTPASQSPLSQLSLTPGYAAPERVAGAPVTTLADIYSLGKILDVLIAGQEVPELAAIAAKAADPDPDARYDSAALMARDIGQYRRSEPVEAFSAGRAYRARKYLRRHRLPAAFAALAVLLLLFGLGAVTSAYRSEARARAAAEQRFDDVRALSNFMLFDLYDEIEDVPGTTRALNQMADRARQYLDSLSRTEGAPTEVKVEAALAYKRLADVLGTPTGANLGRREEAGETLATAIAQLRTLHAADPGNARVTEGLASALYSRAVYAFIVTDDNLAAHQAAAESARLFWQLAKGSDRDRFLPRAIDAEVEAATPLAWIGRGKEGADMLAKTLVRLERHMSGRLADPDLLTLRARTQSALSETLSRVADAEGGDYGPALVQSDRAIASYEAAIPLAARPDAVRRSLMAALFKRAMILGEVEREADALADLDRAEHILDRVIARDADDLEAIRNLATIREQKALTLAHMGRAADARRVASDSLGAKRSAAEASPDDPGRQRELASNLQLSGEIFALTGDNPSACARYREADGLYRVIKRRFGLSEFDREVVTAELPASIDKTC